MSDETLAARFADLTPEAREFLRRRLASRRAADGLAVPRRDPTRPVPVSFAQWRLWFLEQLRPGTNAWNTPVAARLTGPLDVAALHRALQLLVDRHATLRTVFRAHGGNPEPVAVEDARLDLGVLGGDSARDFVEREVAQPFDLERDLMLRARLLRLSADEHVLVLVAHHIACDGWSKRLLLDELSTAYAALARGEAPTLPELPIEYADYALWQRDRLSGETLERLMTYWRQRLAAAPPALELPTDHPRPQRQAFEGALHWLEVPADLARAAIALGRAERATPFMTMLAAFKALLFARSGQEDVLVGSPAAMRTHPELESIVGLFANTLVYRTSLAGAPTFRQLLQRVRETAIGVYQHQDLPFEKIVEAARPLRDPSRNPLVQVNMRVEGPEPRLALAGLQAEPIEIDPGIARFDLAIELAATGDGFGGYLEYDAALFEPATARAYADGFMAILREAVSAPDTPLTELGSVRAVRA